VTADLAEWYGRQLDEIGEHVISMHTHDVYDPDRMEFFINRAICGACAIERIIDKEPPPCP
jgi:hypothetical protein